MIKYQTTTDKVLAFIPTRPTEEQMIGGIHLPPNVSKESLSRNPISELVVHSVGPECKTVKVGDRCLYNRNHITALPVNDGELIVLPEGQIIAVIKEALFTKIVAPRPESPPLTIDEIRSGLGIPEAPVDDASALPVDAPKPDAQPA